MRLLLAFFRGSRYRHTRCGAVESPILAGCGTDAAPYFRVFNPVLQGKKFDPAGTYVRKWIPGIAKLSNKFLHQPWTAPPKTLAAARIDLGKTYPMPIADLKATRVWALDSFAQIQGPRRKNPQR